MDDIIPIIRQCQLDEPVMSLLQDAADEIERLRAMVDQCDHHEHQLQAINAEVDKLRADSEKYLKLAASYKSDLERLRGSEVCWGGEDD